MSPANPTLIVLILIFALSGFSGLIYESVWSHYLKLLLGHASYAQVLVLTIFMGGMAIGAALAARFSHRLTNLILWYGIVEGVIGLFGIVFHDLFVLVHGFAFEVLFPGLGEPWLVHGAKWSLGALLILPQSILLGATFPLLTAGIMRRFPGHAGATLGTLYFVNSLGGAIGVLCNAFLLVPKVGLEEAAFTAGLINIALAIAVSRIAIHDRYPAPQASLVTKSTAAFKPVGRYLLLVAAGTGFASFMYEIGWIRMLTMVLGGSTHSFEIMLSAFILGLAIGGFWIRNKIERFDNPLLALGLIQLAMGALAVLTIPIYNQTYELMGFFMDALDRNESGYLLYNLFSYGISLIVMLPATICAGTTLPLLTYILLRNQPGDAAVGRVYAWNTVGSILGVAMAVLLVMPWLGLKWVIVGGALIDGALGAWLIHRAGIVPSRQPVQAGVMVLCASVFVAIPVTGVDIDKMASGVFRYGYHPERRDASILFHRDGKTSTVAVEEKGDIRILLNNGKPDAGIRVRNRADTRRGRIHYSADEPTMVLIGLLPYLYNPEPRHIANIGLGSGLTAHALLADPGLERLDTIEVEQFVHEAAQLFRPNVDRFFSDPRSNIVIEDAKTFFAASGEKYDAIVSEPSNPWVSGVSGLFSTEFYEDVRRYMKDDGLLIQWIQLYEITPSLVASVYWALRENFTEVHLYQISSFDVAIVAGNVPLKANFHGPFASQELRAELEAIRIATPEDLAFRKLAGTAKLDMVFAPLASVANSDYFPLLDSGAARARFMDEDAYGFFEMRHFRAIDRLLGEPSLSSVALTEEPYQRAVSETNQARQSFRLIMEYLQRGSAPVLAVSPALVSARRLSEILLQCRQAQPQAELGSRAVSRDFMELTLSFFRQLEPEQSLEVFRAATPCIDRLDPMSSLWIRAHLAWLEGDHDQVERLTTHRLSRRLGVYNDTDKQILLLNLASRIRIGKPGPEVRTFWERANASPDEDLELMALYRWFKWVK